MMSIAQQLIKLIILKGSKVICSRITNKIKLFLKIKKKEVTKEDLLFFQIMTQKLREKMENKINSLIAI